MTGIKRITTQLDRDVYEEMSLLEEHIYGTVLCMSRLYKLAADHDFQIGPDNAARDFDEIAINAIGALKLLVWLTSGPDTQGSENWSHFSGVARRHLKEGMAALLDDAMDRL